MKKAIIALAVILFTTIGNSFATTTNPHIPIVVQQSFQEDYSSVTLLGWEENQDYYTVKFKQGEEYLSAFYSLEGEKIGWAKNIGAFDLPATLLSEIKTDYTDYWVTELFVINISGETTYYLTLENADEKLSLKNSDQSWSIYKSNFKF